MRSSVSETWTGRACGTALRADPNKSYKKADWIFPICFLFYSLSPVGGLKKPSPDSLPLEGKGDRLRWMRCPALERTVATRRVLPTQNIALVAITLPYNEKHRVADKTLCVSTSSVCSRCSQPPSPRRGRLIEKTVQSSLPLRGEGGRRSRSDEVARR